MTVDWSLLNSIIIALLTAALAFLSAVYWGARQRNHIRDARIAELEKRLEVVTAAVVPISTAFQAILIRELTHFHTPELDSLMARIGPPSTLTLAETARLERLLAERSKNMAAEISGSERDAATMLPLVMRRARAELQAANPVVPPLLPVDKPVQLVSLPPIVDTAGPKPDDEDDALPPRPE